MAILSFVLAVCGVLILSLVEPRNVFAETSDGHDPIVMNHGKRLSHDTYDDFDYMFDATTGRVLYCISSNSSQPYQNDHLRYGGEIADVSGEGDDLLPFSGVSENDDRVARVATMTRAFDYIAYHGFSGDSSISIGSLTGDTDKLYLATQLAIYYVINPTSKNTPCDFDEETISQDIIQAATTLYDQAMTYAASGTDGVEAHTAIWYEDIDNEDCQHILTCAAKGRIYIKKVSSDPGVSAADTGYSLEAAEFTVCRQGAPDKILERITTNESGEATTSELPYGTYILREAKAPDGFAINQDETSVTITGGPRFVTVEESPIYALVGTLLTKVDAETGIATPIGAGSLAGANFLVSYYAGYEDEKSLPNAPTRSWMLATDKSGVISLDEEHLVSDDYGLYLDHNGSAVLPMGVITIQEVSAPNGYLIPPVHTWTTVVSEAMSGKQIILVPEATVRESAIRGDIEFDKIDEASGAKMPNVVFRVTSQTTGESHLIMTDGQGHFSSRTYAHSQETNGLDTALNEQEKLEEEQLTQGCGTWFYGYLSHEGYPASKIDDSRGAFPYDCYTFEELASSSTLNHELVSFEVTVAEDNVMVDKGAVKDTTVTLSTVARDSTGGDKYLTVGQTGQAITDKVSYAGLTPGVEYTLTCTLVDGSDGKRITDGKGKPLTASHAFTPQAAEGTQELTVKLGEWAPSAGRIVAYEQLTRQDQLIASHEDLDDASQTLYIPSLSTTLTDTEDDDHAIPSDSICTLVDTVEYHGLVPGETYLLEGTLMDGQTRLALTDSAGQQIKTTITLTPSKSDGSASVSFEVNTAGLADHPIVAFETVTQNDKVICSHTDLNDEGQTVNVVRNFVSLPNTGSNSLPIVLTAGTMLLGLGLCCRNVGTLWRK